MKKSVILTLGQMLSRVASFFLGTAYQKVEIYTKWPQNIPKGLKNIRTFPIPRPSKIFPKWDFWYAITSGNPDAQQPWVVLGMTSLLNSRWLFKSAEGGLEPLTLISVTQSESDRSCILLLRLQRQDGGWVWVHTVLQVKENLENSQSPVIVCTNQVLR
jgi:hypothetical protein